MVAEDAYVYIANGMSRARSKTATNFWEIISPTPAGFMSRAFFANGYYIYASNGENEYGSLSLNYSKDSVTFRTYQIEELAANVRAEIVGFVYCGGFYLATVQYFERKVGDDYDTPIGTSILLSSDAQIGAQGSNWQKVFTSTRTLFAYFHDNAGTIQALVQPHGPTFYRLQTVGNEGWDQFDLNIDPSGYFPSGRFNGAFANGFLVFEGLAGVGKSALGFNTVQNVPWNVSYEGRISVFDTAIVRNDAFYTVSMTYDGSASRKILVHRTVDFVNFDLIQVFDVSALGLDRASATVDTGTKAAVSYGSGRALVTEDGTSWTFVEAIEMF